MSTPKSRKTLGGQEQTPETTNLPYRASPISQTTESPSLNPKSEYLRSALHDRRVRACTPAVAADPVDPPSDIPNRTASKLSPSDPWLSCAQSDSESSDHTPVRRRQQSHGGTQRLRKQTQRELETQQDKLKTANFDLGLKLRLIEEQNGKLKNDLEAATKRIEDLEPLEEKMDDLQEDNDQLRLQLQNMEEDLVALEDKHRLLKGRYVDLKAKNEECLAINQDLISEMEKRDAGLSEAADLIFQLEEENTTLKAQLSQCAGAGHGTSRFGTDAAADTPPAQPMRVYSIDESRPSTSNIDSDYYSQPASPQVRPDRYVPQTPVGPYAERVRDLVDKSLQSRKSVNELKKRMSQVSLSGATQRTESPVPDVPKIPDRVHAAEPAAQTSPSGQKASKIPKSSPMKGGTPSTPRSSLPSTGGLRNLYQSGGSVKKLAPPPKLDFKSRAVARGQDLQDDYYDGVSLLTPPVRSSSKSAHTSSSSEQLNPEFGSPRSVQTSSGADSSSFLAPSDTAVVDDDDQTTGPDPQNRWWKDLSRLQGPQGLSPSRPPTGRNEPLGPELFNAAEDEDQFMARAKKHFFRRR